MIAGIAVALTGQSTGLGQAPKVRNAPAARGGPVDSVRGRATVPPDLPSGSETSVDGSPAKAPFDDPLFLSPLQVEEGDAGFSLGETSLPDPMLGDAVEPAVQRPPARPIIAPDAGRFNRVTGEALPEDAARNLLLNAAVVSPRTVTQRTALHQAFSTGESILGDLSALRGVISSPFLPTRQRELLPAFQIGVVDFRPHATVGLVVGQSSQNEGGGDVEAGAFFQAGITAALRNTGRFSGALDYTIGTSPSSGSSSGAQDYALDHLLSLSTDFRFPEMSKVHFSLGVDYAHITSVDRDVGTAVERNLATVALATSYDYSRKTSFDWDVIVPIRDISEGTSSVGVTSTFFVNNQVTKRTKVGLGFALGTLTVDDSSSARLNRDSGPQGSVTQWFQQLLLRADYRPSALFSFDGTLGLEVREVGDSTNANPIFGFGVVWKPRLETEVSLAAERRTFNAGTALNTNFTSTSVTLGASQRIGYRLTASLSFGYEHATYEGDRESNDNGRVDDLLSISGGLTLEITRRWSCTLTLSAGKNISNVQPFEYVQGVLQTSYEF